jgi:SAM-dependent methyltransferase
VVPYDRTVDRTEIIKLAELEDTHWWYRERRHLLARQIRGMTPGRAVDVGAAAGGNTRVLLENGWDSIALEFSEDGAAIARDRGLPVLRADALSLPFSDTSLDLVVAYDVLEHIEDDDRVVQEFRRVLREGGTALIAVPADPRLWSAHDVAVGHVRRYTRDTLVPLLDRNGLAVETIGSWNVLLRPVVRWHRRKSTGSDQEQMPPMLNSALHAVVAAERYLPVRSWPGVSLLVRARRT